MSRNSDKLKNSPLVPIYPCGEWGDLCNAMRWLNFWYRSDANGVGADSIDIQHPAFVAACQKWRNIFPDVVTDEVANPANVLRLLIAERKLGRLSYVDEDHVSREGDNGPILDLADMVWRLVKKPNPTKRPGGGGVKRLSGDRRDSDSDSLFSSKRANPTTCSILLAGLSGLSKEDLLCVGQEVMRLLAGVDADADVDEVAF